MSATNIPSPCRITIIDPNDVMILPHNANLHRIAFSERTGLLQPNVAASIIAEGCTATATHPTDWRCRRYPNSSRLHHHFFPGMIFGKDGYKYRIESSTPSYMPSTNAPLMRSRIIRGNVARCDPHLANCLGGIAASADETGNPVGNHRANPQYVAVVKCR